MPFSFTTRDPASHVLGSPDLFEALDLPQSPQSWLFINPHDDDCLLGAGLLIQAGIAAGVKVCSAICTDGRMGYVSENLRATIVAVRKEQTLRGYQHLGVLPEQIFHLGYPDAQIHFYLGRRAARPEDADARCGHSGLLNSLVWLMRRVKPSVVFINTNTDLHPDHKAVAGEAAWAVFMAPSIVWPELGEGFPPPVVWEYLVYSPFSGPPTLELRADSSALERKVEALAKFASQGQIEPLLAAVRNGGPVEYFRRMEYGGADLAAYGRLFKKS